ncbi:MAG: hypothetical protein AB8G16_19570 [Gammaproteobacteria bacterium]
MRRRKNFALCMRAAWAVALVGSGTIAVAQSLLPDDDGWYAWAVEARTDDQRCCFQWDGGKGRSSTCNLDGASGGDGSDDYKRSPTGNVVVYVKRVRGQVEHVTALSASCQVKTKTPIERLDGMTAAQSVALLGSLLGRDDDLADEVLNALAAHAGQDAPAAILNTARHADDEDIRSKAWFWLAQSQWARTEQAVMTALVNDPSHFARQGAVFALSQLHEERSANALIKVVETPTLDQRDRKQALFWLAQDENPKSLDYLSKVLQE